MRSASPWSASYEVISAAWTRSSFGPDPVGLGADAVEQPDHRLDVVDARHVRERHRLVGEQARGEDRQRAVLVPGGADPAAERMTAFDDERLGGHLPTGDGARQRPDGSDRFGVRTPR